MSNEATTKRPYRRSMVSEEPPHGVTTNEAAAPKKANWRQPVVGSRLKGRRTNKANLGEVSSLKYQVPRKEGQAREPLGLHTQPKADAIGILRMVILPAAFALPAPDTPPGVFREAGMIPRSVGSRIRIRGILLAAGPAATVT